MIRFSAISELKSRKKAKNDADLNSIVSKSSCDDRRTNLRGKETGKFLLVLPTTVNGTELSAQEYRDVILLRYHTVLIRFSPRIGFEGRVG